MVIYKTINQVNGKFYIGKDEKNNSEYLGSGLLLNRAIEKYGRDNFKKEIIETCETKTQLNEREIYWIKELKAIEKGYNIALGGCGGDTYTNNPKLLQIIENFKGEKNHFYGKRHSVETKNKISDVHKGKSSWNKGKTNIYTAETKKKMSDARVNLTGESSGNFVKIDKNELIDVLHNKTRQDTAKYFGVSCSCIRRKMKDFNIDKNQTKRKRTTPSVHYYVISDTLFNEILKVRGEEKKTIVELAKCFNIGVNKLRLEFKLRNITLKRIR